jgi:hypothetical protein
MILFSSSSAFHWHKKQKTGLVAGFAAGSPKILPCCCSQ